MASLTPTATIIERQRRWARSSGLRIDRAGRTLALEENLFLPLHPQTRKEFLSGAGDELSGDMRSLRSSSALVCNFFDSWRHGGGDGIGLVCADESETARISFERRFPTGLGGTPPHIDVVLDGAPTGPIAIESKFSEPYGRVKNDFAASYFETTGLWAGLERCREMAEMLHARELQLRHLGAAQLLKHILGLARAYGPRGFELLYLWYEVPGEAARLHATEIEAFAAEVGDEVRFRSSTYQEFAQRARELAATTEEHLGYLAGRYGL